MIEVTLPKKMRALGKDRRGYPIPYILLRDTDGRPHYTVNDTHRVMKALQEKRCGICGTRLDKPMWFVGGPLSALHMDGAYIDSALHHECMTYALQVCPYLAAPNYSGRIDTATIDPAKVPDVAIFLDTTMIPERPAVFVAIAALGQDYQFTDMGTSRIRPHRPFVAIEYWRQGKRLGDSEGAALAAAAVNARGYQL